MDGEIRNGFVSFSVIFHLGPAFFGFIEPLCHVSPPFLFRESCFRSCPGTLSWYPVTLRLLPWRSASHLHLPGCSPPSVSLTGRGRRLSLAKLGSHHLIPSLKSHCDCYCYCLPCIEHLRSSLMLFYLPVILWGRYNYTQFEAQRHRVHSLRSHSTEDSN